MTHHTRPAPTATIGRSEDDQRWIVQIDTQPDTGPLTITLNDGPPSWDGDPEPDHPAGWSITTWQYQGWRYQVTGPITTTRATAGPFPTQDAAASAATHNLLELLEHDHHRTRREGE